MIKRTAFLIPLLLLAFSTPSFAAKPAPVTIRLAFEAETLDWNEGDVPIHVINNVMEGLYRVSADGLITNCEALRAPKRIGPSRWRIELRPGLRWSNGAPVQASDYVYAWTRLRDPKLASSYSYLLKEIESFQAVSDSTIEIVTRGRKLLDPALFTHWATFPVQKGTNWKNIPAIPVNGPYQFSKGSLETGFEIQPNPQHRSPGKLPRVSFLVITEDSTAFRLYETGKLQFMTDLAGLDRKKILKHPDYYSVPGPVLVYLGVNAADPFLGKAETRALLSAAIDRAEMERLLDGQGSATQSISPSEKAMPNENQPLRKLKSKLELAFFERGANKMLIEFIQNQWKEKLGLNAALHASDIKSYWARLKEKPYPVFLNSFGPPVWSIPYYYGLLTSDNPMNLGRWKNADYDAAVERGQWQKAARIFHEELPVIPLYFRKFEYLKKSGLKGVILNPMTSLDLQNAEYNPSLN